MSCARTNSGGLATLKCNFERKGYTMACADVYFEAFKTASESLTNTMYKQDVFRNSAMFNLIMKGEFPRGRGITHTLFEIGETHDPTKRRNWTDTVTPQTGDSNCGYNFVDQTWGYDELTYSPEKVQLRGPVICKDDQVLQHLSAQFLASYEQRLGQYSLEVLINKFEQEYDNRVPIIVSTGNPSFTEPGAGLAALPQATSEITQQLLDLIAVELFHRMAHSNNGGGWASPVNGAPSWTLQIGMEASQAIQTNNAAFRQDIRDHGSNELLTRVGANMMIKGFRHLINPIPPRYTFAGGIYTEVNPYVNKADDTSGQSQELNPDYLDVNGAPYEGARILSPWVMGWEWVRPANQVANARWKPQSYTGDWMFLTGPDTADSAQDETCFDPFHKRGRHATEMWGAAKPGRNRRAGTLIIFERCHLQELSQATCAPTS